MYAILAAICLGGALALADVGWVTEQHLIDAILDPGAYTPEQLVDLDLNGDGDVDVSDLVCYRDLCHRQANFDAFSSQVDEGDGLVSATVEFDLPTTGRLTVMIAGTADPGADYEIPGATDGTLEIDLVDAVSASIPIQLIDDTDFSESLETIVLRIVPPSVGDQAFSVGAADEHQIQVFENDLPWRGSLILGFVPIEIEMEITRSESFVGGALRGDGNSLIPEGVYPMTIMLSATEFTAETTAIPLAADSDGLGLEMELMLTFNSTEACGSQPPQVSLPTDVDLDNGTITGRVCQVLSSEDHEYLTRYLDGFFSLIRGETAFPDSELIPEIAP